METNTSSRARHGEAVRVQVRGKEICADLIAGEKFREKNARKEVRVTARYIRRENK